MIGRRGSTSVVAIVVTGIMALAAPMSALAEEPPVKEEVSSHTGWEVNTKTGGSFCIGESECQPGKQSTGPGGFGEAGSVAVDEDPVSAHYRHVYVADTINYRVEEFDESGQFVSMFGWDVNQTKDGEAGATQAEKNVCTVASGNVCREGLGGTAAGQLDAINSVAIDPSSGDVYIAEYVDGGNRVQQFTAEGQFVRELGKEVNAATGGNACTAGEEAKGVNCVAPAPIAPGTVAREPDAFSFDTGTTDSTIIAFGGPESLLYVGEYGRVQELSAGGTFKGELQLGTLLSKAEGYVSALAVDPVGDIYLVYRAQGTGANAVHELSPGGAVKAEMVVGAQEPGGSIEVKGLALDPAGRLGLTEYEESALGAAYRGRLYGVATGQLHLITEFTDPSGTVASNQMGIRYLAFNDRDNMFASDVYYVPSYGEFARELIGYTHIPVGEPLPSTSKTRCQPGSDSETDATVICDLEGEVNPWGVSETHAWFEWGPTPRLGNASQSQIVCVAACNEVPVALTPVSVENLRPNQALYYRVAATDANVKLPEILISETVSLHTESLPPRVVGPLEASFVRPFSVDLSAAVNPENTSTTYWFQYAMAKACESLEGEVGHPVAVAECPDAGRTESLESNEYGSVPAILEANGLQPGTLYRYRLFATNEAGQPAVDEAGRAKTPEATFETGPLPAPEAVSGIASAIGTTTATISGFVNPDGQSAAYEFQLGVYNGAATQFGVIFSGDAGAGSMPVEEALQLSSLQAGTTYAFRLVASGPHGTRYGASVAFSTQGLPSVIEPPPLLTTVPVPSVTFPRPRREQRLLHGCKRRKVHSVRGHCMKTHHKKARSKGRRRRRH